LQSKKPNHIYKITKDAEVYKIGESGQGVKKEMDYQNVLTNK